jgi:ZIP family zinc transporter
LDPTITVLAYSSLAAAAAALGVVPLLVRERLPIAWIGWSNALAATHAASRTTELELNRLEEMSLDYGYKILLVNTLHSSAEGVAIGAAMAVNLPFGALVALAIAAHNVPEGTVLSSVLTSRGVRLSDAAGLAVVTNVTQVLLAVVTYAIVAAEPAVLPWALGVAAGALVFLVMFELLPECYRQAGPRSIALVTIVAMGIVVLLSGRGI